MTRFTPLADLDPETRERGLRILVIEAAFSGGTTALTGGRGADIVFSRTASRSSASTRRSTPRRRSRRPAQSSPV